MTSTTCNWIPNIYQGLSQMTGSPQHFAFQLAWILRAHLVLSRAFRSNLGRIFSFHQILENEKILLVLFDRDRVFIYLERLLELDNAIQGERPVKCLNLEKLGEGALFSFDEIKRALVVCAPTKVSHQKCHRSRRVDLICHLLSVTTPFVHF
jgi:hypothetical protein